jgi:predicted O-linked N-acetylglucosamine transferase (SPINDLY family)
MGSLQLKPTSDVKQVSAFAFSTATNTAWLNGLLVHLSVGIMTPDYKENVLLRLNNISFEMLLSTIEQVRSNFTSSAEIAFYMLWIEANQGTSPLLHAAWFNIGVLFTHVGNHINAAIAYRNALTLRSDMHAAAINLGLLLEATGQLDDALTTWKGAIQSDEERITMEIQQGRLLEKLGHFEDAERILRRVVMANSNQPDVVHHWIHIRQKICQWPVTPSNIPGISAAELIESSGPLGILALTDDIDSQRAAAAAWIARKIEPASHQLAAAKPYSHERIRIGYMSSDFCSHAMSYLITELFEHHDRQRFEVFGYCSSEDDGTELRKRVLAAFDHYRIIRMLSDEQAAQIIRDDEIDVLIDLNGITDGSRLSVLQWRPAPIQATYLGFIGSVPLPELDYLLCDNVVIPSAYEPCYQPKPLPIARIYQANDSRRTMGRRLSRAEVGLPEDCFVFCCFSKHYKITEAIFAAWISILQQTNQTVMWLTTDNIYSQANMIALAEHANIAPHRLIFSERADPDLYLSRLGLADLFLDTFPYNAGTVASDAIRMQLPLMTLCGKAFASRMAASLLHTVGAPQGVTTSFLEYIDTAVRFASNSIEYARYKALFANQAWKQTIGNITCFTKEFEDTWYQLVSTRRNT